MLSKKDFIKVCVSSKSVSYLRPPLLVADELFVLEVNNDDVAVRHGDHKTTSVWCFYDLLIRDLLLLSEELLINVCENADDRE